MSGGRVKDEGLFGRGGKRGAGAEAWKNAEGVVAVIQQHTQREKEALAVDGERGNNYTNNYAIIKLFWKLFLKLFAHY